MGNCVNHEMHQPPPRQRRGAPHDEDEVKPFDDTRSVATAHTTGEALEEQSPSRSVSDRDLTESKDPPNPIDDAGDPSVGDPSIEEPQLIKRVISEPTKDTAAIIADSAVSKEQEEPEFVLPQASKFVEAENPVTSEDLAKSGVEHASDTDSVSSQVIHEIEPPSLTLDKPAKAASGDSKFKRSAGLFLCLLGLLAGSIVMTQRSGPQDIRSILIRKARPAVECTGDNCHFLNWVEKRDGVCSSPDRSTTEEDEKFTLCPPHVANSTLPIASSPTCNFAAWVGAQDMVDKCSLDAASSFEQIWSKYVPFGSKQTSKSLVDDDSEDVLWEEEGHGHFDWLLGSLKTFKFHGTLN